MTSRGALNDASMPHGSCRAASSASRTGHAALAASFVMRSNGVQPPLGRFIWQLVGVLETYGSICLIGTKVKPVFSTL